MCTLQAHSALPDPAGVLPPVPPAPQDSAEVNETPPPSDLIKPLIPVAVRQAVPVAHLDPRLHEVLKARGSQTAATPTPHRVTRKSPLAAEVQEVPLPPVSKTRKGT